MSVSVTLPPLGESVTEGTVTRWLKQVGDTVAADEPLVEVSTDKVDTEIPSPASGVLLAISVPEDGVVAVGGELAVIGEASEAPAPAPSAPATPPPAAASVSVPVAPAPVVAAPVPTHATVPAHGTTSVVLPPLGESVTEGTVTRWLKQVGDAVAADEPLVEVSTDKVDTEIPAPAGGILLAIRVPVDATVAVGAELAVIGDAGALPAGGAGETPAPAAMTPPAAIVPATPVTPAPMLATPAPAPTPTSAPTDTSAGAPASDEEPYVTPLVRKLAAERGVDLATVVGTGVGGRVRKQDVIAAGERAAAPAPTPAPIPAASNPAASASTTASTSPSTAANVRGTTQPLSRLRRVIAERLVESLQTSAQLTTVIEVDVTRIANLRDRSKHDFEAREGVKLTFLPFFAKAAVEAVAAHPAINASIDLAAGTVTYHGEVNLGVAVDTERGLLVPVVRDAGDLSVAGLARRISDVAERTRSNRVAPDELSGGTFTITNTGSRGALFDTPILNLPQVAILGTGAVVKRPVVVKDESGGDVIAIRSMVYLALTYDHRLVDGADAARFLSAVRSRLEEGTFADVGA